MGQGEFLNRWRIDSLRRITAPTVLVNICPFNVCSLRFLATSPFYEVELEEISHGSTVIDGRRSRLVIDSGCTYSMLQHDLYTDLVASVSGATCCGSLLDTLKCLPVGSIGPQTTSSVF